MRHRTDGLDRHKSMNVRYAYVVAICGLIISCLAIFGCAPESNGPRNFSSADISEMEGELSDKAMEEGVLEADAEAEDSKIIDPQIAEEPDVKGDATLPQIDIIEDYRPSFVHGEKGASHQKYIVIHDTEGGGSPQSVVDYWDGNGNLIAAHFVIGKDGTIVQCVALDKIAHHAGYGDTGHNEVYGIIEDGRDDMLGSTPIGSWASDYGMNAWSIGIELVHNGATDSDYPEEQLAALDGLIAYIDEYYGFQSAIIDHKSWRTGNSDTSPEFDRYMENYQAKRTHT